MDGTKISVGNCPDCGKPFGKIRRCFDCKPATPKKAGRKTPKLKSTPTSGILAAMTAAEGVRRAVEGLDLGTATDVLTFVMDRLE